MEEKVPTYMYVHVANLCTVHTPDLFAHKAPYTLFIYMCVHECISDELACTRTCVVVTSS